MAFFNVIPAEPSEPACFPCQTTESPAAALGTLARRARSVSPPTSQTIHLAFAHCTTSLTTYHTPSYPLSAPPSSSALHPATHRHRHSYYHHRARARSSQTETSAPWQLLTDDPAIITTGQATTRHDLSGFMTRAVCRANCQGDGCTRTATLHNILHHAYRLSRSPSNRGRTSKTAC